MSWAATALPWLLKRWHWLAIAGLGALLLYTRGELVDARADLRVAAADRKTDAAVATAASAEAERSFAERQSAATQLHADRTAAIAPIIIRSTDTVREYAQTDAGRARCLGPDRVRGIDALDRDLAAHPGPAPQGADAVSGNAAAPASGWFDELGRHRGSHPVWPDRPRALRGAPPSARRRLARARRACPPLTA